MKSITSLSGEREKSALPLCAVSSDRPLLSILDIPCMCNEMPPAAPVHAAQSQPVGGRVRCAVSSFEVGETASVQRMRRELGWKAINCQEE